jgi:hypothetical protein
MAPFFERIADDIILVEMPNQLRTFIDAMAQEVRLTLGDPTMPAHPRLAAPINPALNDDDPLSRLEREMTIETNCDIVFASVALRTITLDQARAWQKVLSVAAGLRAHELGVVTAADRENLDEMNDAFFTALSALQYRLIVAIDPELDAEINPGLYEGLEDLPTDPDRQ